MGLAVQRNRRNAVGGKAIDGYVDDVPIQYVRNRELLEAEVGEDIVALDVEGGHCFGFNSVAADIWRLLDQPRDFNSLLDFMMDRYDVEITQCSVDLKSCLADLEVQGLIRSTTGS